MQDALALKLAADAGPRFVLFELPLEVVRRYLPPHAGESTLHAADRHRTQLEAACRRAWERAAIADRLRSLIVVEDRDFVASARSPGPG